MQDFRVSVADNGEIVHSEPLTDRFKDSFNVKSGYRIRRSKMGSCQYNCYDFPQGLSFADIGKLTVLTRKFLMKGNVIGCKQNGRIYSFKSAGEIGKAIGVSSKTQSGEFVKRMIDCDAIRKFGNTFYVNPVFFIKNGDWLTFDLFAKFYLDVRVLMPAALYRQMFEACMNKGLLSSDDYEKAKMMMG